MTQDFLAMQLPESRFDGVFANASLFHVPSQELPRILPELFKTLKPRGVLFSSNPRGNNEESFADERYACFFDLDTWRDYVLAAGFVEVGHYYQKLRLKVNEAKSAVARPEERKFLGFSISNDGSERRIGQFRLLRRGPVPIWVPKTREHPIAADHLASRD